MTLTWAPNKEGDGIKPKWADEWVEQEFMYGTERGFMAQVGPLKNAVRSAKTVIVRPAVLSDTDYVQKDVEFMDENGDYCTRKEFVKKVIKPAKYKEVPVMEARADAQEHLRDWFENKVSEARELIEAAERNGLV